MVIIPRPHTHTHTHTHTLTQGSYAEVMDKLFSLTVVMFS